MLESNFFYCKYLHSVLHIAQSYQNLKPRSLQSLFHIHTHILKATLDRRKLPYLHVFEMREETRLPVGNPHRTCSHFLFWIQTKDPNHSRSGNHCTANVAGPFLRIGIPMQVQNAAVSQGTVTYCKKMSQETIFHV